MFAGLSAGRQRPGRSVDPRYQQREEAYRPDAAPQRYDAPGDNDPRIPPPAAYPAPRPNDAYPPRFGAPAAPPNDGYAPRTSSTNAPVDDAYRPPRTSNEAYTPPRNPNDTYGPPPRPPGYAQQPYPPSPPHRPTANPTRRHHRARYTASRTRRRPGQPTASPTRHHPAKPTTTRPIVLGGSAGPATTMTPPTAATPRAKFSRPVTASSAR
jgi:hypothetical protein